MGIETLLEVKSKIQTLVFPDELGRCHGSPLIFFDTNALIDAKELVNSVFFPSPSSEGEEELRVLGVICDFIEGEAKNLNKGLDTLEELNKKSPHPSGFYFETKYNSFEGARRALADMPTGEMAEAVLIEYDKKLDPSGMAAVTKQARRAADSKSKFGDFSLLTVATICASRRKKQSIIVSRDRWIKLSCKSLHKQFKLPIHCEDQWSFSLQEIMIRAKRTLSK